jgi:hypothetical protein
MIQQIADALVQSWQNFATAFAQFVPRLIAATIIFAAGFVVALALRRVIYSMLVSMHFDRLAQRTGASDMLRNAGLPVAELVIAKIVFWIVWIGFIVSAVDTLQFAPFEGLVQEFFRFVPRFLIALLVFTLGFLIGNFLWRATLLAAVNAGVPGARLLSGALRLLVIAITFGAPMLGAAIAFGLGGRDAAKQLIERQFRASKERESDAAPHL